LRQHDRALFILLSSVVRNLRMAVFWVACPNAVAAVIMVLRKAAAIGPLLCISLEAGGGAAWTVQPKAWLGIREL
jgi:hypothetical protein